MKSGIKLFFARQDARGANVLCKQRPANTYVFIWWRYILEKFNILQNVYKQHHERYLGGIMCRVEYTYINKYFKTMQYIFLLFSNTSCYCKLN